MYYAPMKNVQVRNVPHETHRVLSERAAEAGQSLQEYLLAELNDLAAKPTLPELMRRVESRSGGGSTMEETVRWIREDRESRHDRRALTSVSSV